MSGKAVLFLAVIYLFVYLTDTASVQPQALPTAGGNQRLLGIDLPNVINKLLQILDLQPQGQKG